ncbi:C40 family peptidase [uncultured Oscillibacter sp.]|uniref:C40 family peptidase n=1 Tax=uncultured Oscillibacter sp. TaxID=876091 RepID=UPI00261FA069|nr:C40 family peptidase [uncultured Oscillibacter sp.]
MTHLVGKAVRIATLAMIAAVLLGVTALAAEEDIAVAIGATTGSSLRLRSGPSLDASVITMLDEDVPVAVLDNTLDGWYKINYNGNTGFVSADYMLIDQDNIFDAYGRVEGDGVNVRSTSSTDGQVLTVMNRNSIATVSGFEDGWYKITANGVDGYIRSDYLTMCGSSSSAAGSLGSSANDVVSFAKQYLGTRYAYGGSSPSGFDCSGFTMYVYKNFGYSLPHTATGQWQSGYGTRIYNISELQPGDLVFFCDPSRSNGKACSHAGIYVGNGQHIHSSSSRSGGVIISDLTSGYYNTYFVGGIRL